MMENELDMEDIESRLYSQVHHPNAEDEQLSNPIICPTQSDHSNPYTLSNVPKRDTNRYFHKEPPTQPLQPTYIPFDDVNSLQNRISISPISTDITTEGNFSNQFQNNITVNQYTVPVILKKGLNEVLNDTFSGRYFTSWAVQNEHLIGKKRKRSKKERNREKRRQNMKERGAEVSLGVNLNGNAQKQVSSVICVSDDSDDECIIQSVDIANPIDLEKVSTGFPKKYNEDETSKKPESDDDIIYIPPPPIEVVNLDGDDKEQEVIESTNTTSNSPPCIDKLSLSSPKSTEKESSALESSTSNDFLDSTGVENNTNKFNFGLHGSDFNNSQGEFVRPANPVDFCETESSCSTNELNRDFNNSVKTVVFAEVEFPREDIFLENNLERFGTYITPRRNTNKTLDDNSITNAENTEVRDVVDVDSSTDSSSESDYEHSESINRNLRTGGLEANKKLPTLSPMLSNEVRTEVATPKRISSKKKSTSELFKDQSSPTVTDLPEKDLSKKKLIVEISETDSDTVKETPKNESKKLPKKKKKKKKAPTSMPLENGSVIVVDSDTQRKKKKKRALQKSEDNGSEKSQYKKKKGTSETNHSESGENTDECTSRKKRRTFLQSELHEIENKILSDVLAQKLSVEIIKLDDLEQPQDKKKNVSLESNTQNEEITSSQRKKKKNPQEPKAPQNDNIESSTSVNQAEETIGHESTEKSRCRKKKVSSASNSGNEENIDATRKKRKNRSVSKSPEKDNVPSDSEAIVKKKTDQCSESVPDPECNNQENVMEKQREKPRKKKRKSEKENPEVFDNAGDKQQKMKKMTFSELLDQQPLEIEDRIEAEVQRKKRKKSLPLPDTTFVENVHVGNTCASTAESDNRSIEISLSSPKEKEDSTEENKRQPFEELPVNRVDSSVIETDVEEELIVVDDIDPNETLDLIVVDQAESSMVNVEVVLSSDSEYDFKELSDVGKDLELANCTGQDDVSDGCEELIVVDDDSRGYSTNRYAVNEEYSHFDVDAIQRTQTDDPEAWKVSYKDTCMAYGKRPRQRCNRCRHFGHLAVRCTEKLVLPNCSLCGTPGHLEARCPNKICRQCGNEGDYSTSYCWKCFKFRNSICKLCNMEGHIAKTCPDLWRRYHLTTKEGPLIDSRQPQLKPRDQLWCSGCARRGHMEHECNYFREYPPMKPSIVSYEDVLHGEGANWHQKPKESNAVCSGSQKFPVHPPHDISKPCPQNSSQDPHCQNLPTSSKNMSFGLHRSTQSRVPILPDVSSTKEYSISGKELTRSVSPNKETSERGFATSVRSILLQNNFILQPTSTLHVFSPSESHSIPSLPPETVTDINSVFAESSQPSTSIQVGELSQSKDDNTNKLPIPVNKCLNFTERDYDDFLSVANPGLLCHIRSNQFGGRFTPDDIRDQVQPVLAKMIEQTTGHVIREDQHRIKSVIMYGSVCVVKEFLRKEMSELKCWVSKRDPKFLIRQYFKYNKLSQMREPLTTKTVNDKCFWFRILNMFIFGVHEFDKGRDGMRVLQRFLMTQKPNKFNRGYLLQAHKQIFGVDKHGGVNYPGLIQQIIDRK